MVNNRLILRRALARPVSRSGSMLYLSRRVGEAVIINNAIEVRVVEVRGKTVKLGLTFPPEASVLREEVFAQIRAENEAAAKAAASLPELVAGSAPEG